MCALLYQVDLHFCAQMLLRCTAFGVRDNDWPPTCRGAGRTHRPALSEKASLESDKTARGYSAPRPPGTMINATDKIAYKAKQALGKRRTGMSCESTRPPAALITDVCVSPLTAVGRPLQAYTKLRRRKKHRLGEKWRHTHSHIKIK